jgi:hypothetical protein
MVMMMAAAFVLSRLTKHHLLLHIQYCVCDYFSSSQQVLRRESQNIRPAGQEVEESVHNEQLAPQHDPISKIVVSHAAINDRVVAAAATAVPLTGEAPPVLATSSISSSFGCAGMHATSGDKDLGHMGVMTSAATTTSTSATSIGNSIVNK